MRRGFYLSIAATFFGSVLLLPRQKKIKDVLCLQNGKNRSVYMLLEYKRNGTEY